MTRACRLELSRKGNHAPSRRRSAPSIVVFAERGDLVLLGARGLEGLNVRVDQLQKALVPAGPVPAAAAGDARLSHVHAGKNIGDIPGTMRSR